MDQTAADARPGLAGMLARLGELTDAAGADAVEGDTVGDAARVDVVALLERIQAAAEAAVGVRFARSQVTAQQRRVLRDPRAVGRGIADQLALACRVSPSEGITGPAVVAAVHRPRTAASSAATPPAAASTPPWPP